jgi:hypothetical protein
MKQILIIVFFLTGLASPAREQVLLPVPPGSNYCPWPPPGFIEIGYRAALVSSTGYGNTPDDLLANSHPVKNEKTGKHADLSGYANRMIETRKELRQLKLGIDLDIEWKKEKVTFYTTGRTYKHGQLDSDYILMGISVSADGKTLCYGFQSTFYGICQGIEQQMEWYSFNTETFVAVIPRSVEKITSTSCHKGPDCSEIP